jgi:nitrogen regulatory protein PII-like uncharacterized protein
MKKLLGLNLQQTLVYEDTEKDLAVRAIHSKHKKVVVIHTFSDDNDIEEIKNILNRNNLEFDTVIFGDGFGCDTWDDKLMKIYKQ